MQLMSESSSSPPGIVALVFGGQSPEHAISCLSAQSVLAALAELHYPVVCIGITKKGNWVRISPQEVASYYISADHTPSVSEGGEPIHLVMNSQEPGVEASGVFTPVSTVFPVLHGIGGEDGAIQGVCQSMGIPVVGSGVRASAICMNKSITKGLVRAGGIDAGNWFSQTSTAMPLTPPINPFPFPWFVKPVSGGSSIGISVVSQLQDYRQACEHAFLTCPDVIVEQGLVHPRELEVGVLAGESGVEASPVGEIKVKDEFGFYDFEAKYISDGAELIVPAELDPKLVRKIQSLAIQVFTLLGCAGYARVDFFLDGDRIVFNEINTIPGFTPISMFARMWAHTGVGFPQIVDRLVRAAVG